ncbi:MAG: hypothetical protein M1840_004786 [Geoglossum simile]|nr:MAG: hypothetical protein M1840_004786 [Geoglossum simile]
MPVFRNRFSVVILSATLLSVVLLGKLWGERSIASLIRRPVHEQARTLADAAALATNETLGFGEILTISLDYRTDRQDFLTLLSDLSRLRLTVIHGVTGDEAAKSPAIPVNTKLHPAELGCWRSHVNAWQHVVNTGVGTALILEDDADWHVNIKEQMALLSRALLNDTNPFPKEFEKFRVLEEFRNTPGPHDPSAPYGDDWDILMLGQCWTALNDPNPIRPGFTYTDVAGPAKAEQPKFVKETLMLYGVNWDQTKDTRVISQSYGPICTTGYAITNRGAHKLLYNLGYLGPEAPVDMQIMGLSMDGGAQDSDTKEADPANPVGDQSGGSSGIGEESARKAVQDKWSLGDNRPKTDQKRRRQR